MNYVDEKWKETLALELHDAEEHGWFTTRLAILIAEGLYGADRVTGKQVNEVRDRIYMTILRERLTGESCEP